MADGGEEIFFSDGLGKGCPVHQLFVRLGGERTLEVSKPLSEAGSCGEVIPCPGAGRSCECVLVGPLKMVRAVFHDDRAVEWLTDKDNGNDLYMAQIGCPEGGQGCGVVVKQVVSLTQVSRDVNVGQAAEVQGVGRIAGDGSRADFVARGVLSEGVNAEGQAPVEGADNLYVYDASTEKVGFVADLCSRGRCCRGREKITRVLVISMVCRGTILSCGVIVRKYSRRATGSFCRSGLMLACRRMIRTMRKIFIFMML